MAINQSNFQQTTQAAISKLEVQLGQIAAEIAQREPGKWPSQTVINPKNQEAKAVHVLRSGKIVDNKVGSDLSNDVSFTLIQDHHNPFQPSSNTSIIPQTLYSVQNHQNSSSKPPLHFPTNFLFLYHHHSPKLIPNHLFTPSLHKAEKPYTPPIPFLEDLPKASRISHLKKFLIF
ncbi:unnamed protein product [Prunus brigantina]